MTFALAALAALAIVIVLAAVLEHVVLPRTRRRVEDARSLVGATLVVHTRRPDDQSLRGVLVAQHADRLTLREVVYLHAGGEVEAGGLVHVPLASVSFMQEIEP